MSKSLEEHKKIALAIRDRNPFLANQVMYDHFNSILISLEEDEKRREKM